MMAVEMIASPPHRSPQNVKVAVDNCIFTIADDELKVLLIQVKFPPLAGCWALPGGLIGNEEDLDTAAARFLRAQAGVEGVYLEQLYTFGGAGRDPLGRVISVAYLSLIDPGGPGSGTVAGLGSLPPPGPRVTPKYADARWWNVAEVGELAYDHSEILAYARRRLKWKIQYTNIVWSLLPRAFTLTDLQRVYEIVLERQLDKRNFRKKLLSLGLVEATGKRMKGGAHRPALLYRFKNRRPEMVEML